MSDVVPPPVEPIPAIDPLGGPKLEDGWALALSGGGYKAAAFHLGAIKRLNELGVLPRLKRISSVSGGSITSGFLGARWNRLTWRDSVAENFDEEVFRPFATFLGSVDIDVGAVLAGFLPGQTASDAVARAYDEHLFQAATLQDLPDEGRAPRFVFNTTNFELNSLWRFSRAYAADYRVGQIDQPSYPLARVVAASSGFPPFFSPATFDLKGLKPLLGADRTVSPYCDRALVMDGGVYDNMGLETIWKRYRTLLVSNAGDAVDEHPRSRSWLSQIQRTISLIHRQAENNRLRWLFALARDGERSLAYWALRDPLGPSAPPGSVRLSPEDAAAAGLTPVRLARLDAAALRRLVCHGYSLADAFVRQTFDIANSPAAVFPDV